MKKKNKLFILIPFFIFSRFTCLFGDEGISPSEWLNSKIKNQPAFTVLPEKPKKNYGTGKVEESSLGGINLNSVGLISVENTSFPGNIWNSSSEKLLAQKVNEMPEFELSSVNKLFKRLLILDTEPPINSIGSKNMGSLFLISRIDKLIEFGAIDEAETILDYIKNPGFELLKRKMDVALINGRLQGICKEIKSHSHSTVFLKFKILCLAREGDWNAAAIIFSVGSTLKLFTPIEKKLLLNFLDPEINIEIEKKEISKNLSPINFYLFLSRNSLPNSKNLSPKYNYYFKEIGTPLMTRIEASEKLVKKFSMNAHHLFSLYRSSSQNLETEKSTLIKSIVELDNALKGDDKGKKLEALLKAINIFSKKNLLPQLSREYEAYLLDLKPIKDYPLLNDLTILLLALNRPLPDSWLDYKSENNYVNCILDINNNNFLYSRHNNGFFCKIIKNLNFNKDNVSNNSSDVHKKDKEVGLIILESLKLLKEGKNTKREDLKLSMRLLKEVGQLKHANQISIELMALNALKEIFHE